MQIIVITINEQNRILIHVWSLPLSLFLPFPATNNSFSVHSHSNAYRCSFINYVCRNDFISTSNIQYRSSQYRNPQPLWNVITIIPGWCGSILTENSISHRISSPTPSFLFSWAPVIWKKGQCQHISFILLIKWTVFGCHCCGPFDQLCTKQRSTQSE